jgi:hypothetical protein
MDEIFVQTGPEPRKPMREELAHYPYDTSILIRAGCGMSTTEIAAEMQVEPKEILNQFYWHFSSRTGITSIVKAGLMMRQNWPEEMKEEALSRGRLIVGDEVFDQSQSLTMILVALNMDDKEISDELKISEKVVGPKLSQAIFPKAGVHNREDLASIVRAEYDDVVIEAAKERNLVVFDGKIFKPKLSLIINLAMHGLNISQIAKQTVRTYAAVKNDLHREIYPRLKATGFEDMKVIIWSARHEEEINGKV